MMSNTTQSEDNTVTEATTGELLPRISLTELNAIQQTNPKLASAVLEILGERAKTLSSIERRQQGVQVLGILSGVAVILTFGFWSFLLIKAGQTVGGSILGSVDLGATIAALIASGQRKR